MPSPAPSPLPCHMQIDESKFHVYAAISMEGKENWVSTNRKDTKSSKIYLVQSEIKKKTKKMKNQICVRHFTSHYEHNQWEANAFAQHNGTLYSILSLSHIAFSMPLKYDCICDNTVRTYCKTTFSHFAKTNSLALSVQNSKNEWEKKHVSQCISILMWQMMLPFSANRTGRRTQHNKSAISILAYLCVDDDNSNDDLCKTSTQKNSAKLPDAEFRIVAFFKSCKWNGDYNVAREYS